MSASVGLTLKAGAKRVLRHKETCRCGCCGSADNKLSALACGRRCKQNNPPFALLARRLRTAFPSSRNLSCGKIKPENLLRGTSQSRNPSVDGKSNPTISCRLRAADNLHRGNCGSRGGGGVRARGGRAKKAKPFVTAQRRTTQHPAIFALRSVLRHFCRNKSAKIFRFSRKQICCFHENSCAAAAGSPGRNKGVIKNRWTGSVFDYRGV